jgi:hypothetical protein
VVGEHAAMVMRALEPMPTWERGSRSCVGEVGPEVPEFFVGEFGDDALGDVVAGGASLAAEDSAGGGKSSLRSTPSMESPEHIALAEEGLGDGAVEQVVDVLGVVGEHDLEEGLDGAPVARGAEAPAAWRWTTRSSWSSSLTRASTTSSEPAFMWRRAMHAP